MQRNIISAEIEPVLNHTNEAALALQRLGFRILHIGKTISVQGPDVLWESIFNVSFEMRKKTVLPGVEGGEVIYSKPKTQNLKVPSGLQQLITGVAFMEPPELY